MRLRGQGLMGNMAWSWAGTFAEAAVAFVLAPMLLSHLGEHGYGLWILLGSMATYMGLLDLGVRGSVGRFVALYRSQDNPAAVHAVLRTGLTMSTAAGVVVLLAGLGLQGAFLRAFDIPRHLSSEVRIALWIVVANLALSLPLSLFDAVLWGARRFDRINQIGIPAALVRLAVTYWAVRQGFGLVGLAAATLLVTALAGVARFTAATRIEPSVLGASGPRMPGMASQMAKYGLTTFAMSVSRMTRLQLLPVLIGWALGAGMVTYYSLSRRLVDYSEAFLVSLTGVATPTFATLQGKGDEAGQLRLFILGGRLSAAIGLLFAGFAIFLGAPFLALWLGQKWVAYAPLLWILAIGEVLPFSQSVTANMLLGLARHRTLAILVAVEVALAAAGAIAVSGRYGLLGICVVLAAMGSVFRGGLVLALGCRVVQIHLRQYAVRVLLPATGACTLAIVALRMLVTVSPPSNWPRLLLASVGYGVCCAVALLVLGGPDLVRAIAKSLTAARTRPFETVSGDV